MISEQYKKYLPWLLLLVLAKFVWMPLIETRNADKAELGVISSQIVKTQNIIENREAFELRSKELEAAINQAERHFFRSEDESAFRLAFQQQLEAESKALNLEVESIRWLEPLREGVVSWFNLEVVLSGSVDDIATFHRYLTRNSEKIAISSVSWRTKSTRGADWQWSIKSNYKLSIPVLEGGAQ
ncbi:hypothetical protein ACPV5J_10730 [Vibrio rotiferianus]|uniref:hypothetical protein n=1 Tax=Vibrio rotiferianus TaxID=190895 RepID=UPI00406AA42D